MARDMLGFARPGEGQSRQDSRVTAAHFVPQGCAAFPRVQDPRHQGNPVNKSKLLPRSLRRFASPCLAVFAALVLLAPIANATPYVVKLVQQGNNVVATGSGAFDLTGLTY